MKKIDENNVKIKPWIGQEYIKGEGLLILGESHYEEKIHCRDEEYTIDSIKEVIKGKRVGFFTKIAKTVLGQTDDLSMDEIGKFWNQVIYYNFIQEFLNEPREAPQPKSWENGVEPFNSVIKKYAPRRVLLLGKQLTDQLSLLSLIQGSDEKYSICGAKGINAISIYHPSWGGFSPKKWSAVLRKNEFLVKIK